MFSWTKTYLKIYLKISKAARTHWETADHGKALANEDTLLRTQMFPRLSAHATFAADTNVVSGTQKMFLIFFRNILCPQQMFLSLHSPRNIMSNNLSATRCPRLPVGSLRKPRQQRQCERRETKGLMSRAMAQHVRYNCWYISLLSTANQQRKMTIFCVVRRTRTMRDNFVAFISNVSPCSRFSFVIVWTLRNIGK